MTDPVTTAPAVDEFAKPEQEFKDLMASMHPTPAQHTLAVAVVLDTAEAVKAEFIALEQRFHAALVRLEDLTVKGVGNPLFAEAKKMVTTVAALAKSL